MPDLITSPVAKPFANFTVNVLAVWLKLISKVETSTSLGAPSTVFVTVRSALIAVSSSELESVFAYSKSSSNVAANVASFVVTPPPIARVPSIVKGATFTPSVSKSNSPIFKPSPPVAVNLTFPEDPTFNL